MHKHDYVESEDKIINRNKKKSGDDGNASEE